MKPREVIIYPNFDYKGNKTGINKLLNKVSNGELLTPNLSKWVFDVAQSKMNDPLLNE